MLLHERHVWFKRQTAKQELTPSNIVSAQTESGALRTSTAPVKALKITGLDSKTTNEQIREPWDVDRHRDSRASLGRYSRPLMGHAARTTHRHQTSHHPRSRARNKGSFTPELRGEENFPAEDGYEYNDWDDSSSIWQQYPAEELDDWEEEAHLETQLAGQSDWIHRDLTLDSYVEEERMWC